MQIQHFFTFSKIGNTQYSKICPILIEDATNYLASVVSSHHKFKSEVT